MGIKQKKRINYLGSCIGNSEKRYDKEKKNSKTIEGGLDIEFNLYNHQKIAVDFHMSREYSAEFSQQGTGKTLTAIEVIRRRVKHGTILRALVVCPASVVDVWEEETNKFSSLKVSVLRGTERHVGLKGDEPISVISYDSVRQILGNLLNSDFDMLVCDESSRVKNPLAKRTQSLIRLSSVIPYRMILSATPIPNNLIDIWSQFMVLDRGKMFTTNFYKFRAVNFTSYPRGKYTEWIPKKEFITNLKNVIKQNSVRFLLEECQDMPPKIYQRLYVNLSGEQKKKYEAISKGLPLEELNFSLPKGKLAEYAKLSQLTSGFLYSNDGRVTRFNTEKIKVVDDLVEDVIMGGQKIIIYYVFDEERNICSEVLKRYRPLHINGKMSDVQKTKSRQTFQTDDNKKLILIQVHCGIGITLTAANVVIYLSNSFSYEDRYQSEYRAYRTGQTKRVTIIDIITRNTIDGRTLEILEDKRDTSEEILDT